MRKLICTISTPDGEELSTTEIQVPHSEARLFIVRDEAEPVAEIDINLLGVTEL